MLANTARKETGIEWSDGSGLLLYFLQDRWLACDLDKYQFIEGFVGFGGGRYQCPGRWFALMEMHLFVAMVMCLFDIELLDKVPQPVRRKGGGAGEGKGRLRC